MKISFITATYNRKDLLVVLYNSLCNLNGRHDIEWILVDDGSTDGTDCFIMELKESSPIVIKYLYKENSGKQSSLNAGFKLCESEISCIIDSDDSIDANTLLYLESDIKKINFFEDDSLSTIIYHSKDKYGQLIGTSFPINYHIDKPYRYYNRRKIQGDKFDFFKTSILTKYSFPVFDDEKFIAESVLWNEIHKSYNAVFINRSLQIVTYLDAGYTRNAVKMRIDNPKGAIYVNFKGFALDTSKTRKLRYCINYFRYKFHSKLYGFCKLEFNFINLIYIMPALIIGFLLHVKDMIHD